MKYLVLGSNGFIGRYIVKELCEKAKPDDVVLGVTRNKTEEIITKNSLLNFMPYGCDLTDAESVKSLMDLYNPDVIFAFHGCATVSSPPDKIWSSNVCTTFNLLEHAPEGCRFVLASSINAKDLSTIYAVSKRTSEDLVECYTVNGLIKGVSLRLCAVAGAYNSHGVVKAVVDKFMKDDEVNLLTNSKKPITYVKEVAEKTVSVLDRFNFDKYCQLNLIPEDSIYVSDIADIVKNILKSNKKVNFSGQSWIGDKQNVYVESTLIDYKMFGHSFSDEAVEKSVRDILKLEYGVDI